MFRPVRWFGVLVLVLGVAGLAPAALVAERAAVHADEAIVYKIKYKGLLSMGSQVEIADAVLRTLSLDGKGYRESEFWITSRDYDVLESVYPFRYRMRSWYEGNAERIKAFETFEENRSEIKHRLYLMNRGENGVARIDLVKEPEAGRLDRLRAAEFPDAPVASRTEAYFDRLSIFQHLRAIEIAPGAQRKLIVRTGKTRIRYEITAGQAERLAVPGRGSVLASTYLIDRIREGDDGSEKRLGDTIKAWIADDERRTPLRAEFPHKLGDVVIEMVERPADSVSYERVAAQTDPWDNDRGTWW